MARSPLKALLSRDLHRNLAEFTDTFTVLDADETLLLGEHPDGSRHPVIHDDIIYGWVIGTDVAPAIAILLSAMIAKELVNEQLADEALGLYREINLVYNLTESLGDTLELKTVACLILTEAQRLIPASRGVVLFLEREADRLHIMESFGEPLDWIGIFQAIARSGKSDIVSDFSTDPRFSEYDAPISWLLFAPLKTKQTLLGALIITSDETVKYAANHLKLLVTLASLAASSMENALLHERTVREEKIRANLLRQFSPKVAESMVSSQKPFELGGSHVAPVTLLFSDIRGFTARSATMEPHEIVRLLNEMFSKLVPIIFKHGGTIDKFVGDAILTVFGSPEPDDDQWERAVRAAIEMQDMMQDMRDIWQIGIGIHTGEAVHGFIGSQERMEYTVIGDTVNKTSRYCDAAQGGEIIVSREVYRYTAGQFEFVDTPRMIKSKHVDTEGQIEGYLVRLSNYLSC
jgi:adenylate cyclase